MSGYVIGTRLVRVEPEGTPFDAIRITGHYELGEEGFDYTVTPADEFGQVVTVAPDGLSAYRPESDADRDMDALRARLDSIEVRG